MPTIRNATPKDIPAIQFVRHSVRENVLSDPSRVTDADCLNFITQRGQGWVAEISEEVVGFAIVDYQDQNVWALFLHPDYENRGLGKRLHRTLLDTYFAADRNLLWLSTDPNTRAERFYELQGWRRVGMTEDGEVKFEMLREDWVRMRNFDS